MKRKLLPILFAFFATMYALGTQAANVITMTTSRNVGETISLDINASGSMTVDGAELTSEGHYDNYKLTKQTVTITGDVSDLYCLDNDFTTIDVSKCMTLTNLDCGHNLLTALDVSQNTALTELNFNTNKITTIDVSNNTELTTFHCDHNPIASVDISKNTKLTDIDCSGCQLTALDVPECPELNTLFCFENKIAGANMDAIVSSLPDRTGKVAGTFMVIVTAGDGNVCTTTQVAAAKAKNWNVLDSYWQAYEGSASNGINNAVASEDNAIESIYSINGKHLISPQRGINIMRLHNGKVLKKIY
jgi:hypothetical protein